MPIELSKRIYIFDQEEFHELDRKLMRIIFDVHNEFGRFLSELLYKREIVERWRTTGFGTAEREVKITVIHETFRKEYQIDALFNEGLLLEAKVNDLLTPACRMQTLNYLLLAGLQHARLVNLRPQKVEHEYV